MKHQFFFLILVLFSACSERLKEHEKTIEFSNLAYDQFNLEKSHKILESVLIIDTLKNEQKCEVLRKLAHQDWKYYQKYDLAKERLIKADSIGNSKYDTWMLISRIERESQHYNEALNAVYRAKKFVSSQNELNKANIEYAKIVYTFSVNQITEGKIIDTNLLTETTKLLSNILKTNAGMSTPSKLLLGIALLNNDGVNVLKGWQSYFQISDIHSTYPYLTSSAEKLYRVCMNWHGIKLNIADQNILIDALFTSRFYEFIPVYVVKNDNESDYNQKIKDGIAYSQYLKQVEKKTNEYYRLIAIGQENENAYKEWLSNKRKELWYKLSFTSQKEYNKSDFLNETKKYFGARGFTGNTANYSGYVLCLGHIVNQETTKVEQYGYKPEFTYTQIDMMVSNGFSSWFWEDKAIGGWATDDEIIRVREVYLNDPFVAWKSITDKIERQKTEKIISRFLDNFFTNQSELLSGLAVKLKYDAINDLYNQLSSDGLSGEELKLAFLSRYKQYRIEASLLAHEGRHSIEKKYMPKQFEKWDNEDREFHAKLSQIIFASEPRLELAEMLNDVSGNSGHSKANKRILEIAAEWIKMNKEKIIEYADNRPDFSQIYQMTVEQIKECYIQADPLNK